MAAEGGEREAKRVRTVEEKEVATQPLDDAPLPSGSSVGTTRRVYVRYKVADGMANQLWRAAAAIQCAIRVRAALLKRQEAALSIWRDTWEVVVLSVDPNMPRAPDTSGRWPNTSPNRPRAYSYSVLWKNAELVYAGPAPPFGKRLPYGPLWVVNPQFEGAAMPSHYLFDDLSHDQPTFFDAWLEETLNGIATHHHHHVDNKPHIIELKGCLQRCEYLPTRLDLLKMLDPQVTQMYKDIYLGSPPDDEHRGWEHWTTHYRGGDYQTLLDGVKKGDFDHMRNILLQMIVEARQECSRRGKRMYLTIVTDPRWEKDAQTWWNGTQLVAVVPCHIAADDDEMVGFARFVGARNIILSPSSFAWWGALLSEAERVWVPYPWMRLFGIRRSMCPQFFFGRVDERPWRWRQYTDVGLLEEITNEPRRRADNDDDDDGDSVSSSSSGSDQALDYDRTTPARVTHAYYLKTYERDAHWAQLAMLAFATHWRPLPNVKTIVVIEADGGTLEAIKRVMAVQQDIIGEITDWAFTRFFHDITPIYLDTAKAHPGRRETYVGQQLAKLEIAAALQDTYGAQFVTYVDSDTIAMHPFCFADSVPDGKRPILVHQPWSADESSAIWKEPTRRALHFEPVANTMILMPPTFHVATVVDLCFHVAAPDPWESWAAATLASEKPDSPYGFSTTFSEFNAIGSLALQYAPNFYQLVDNVTADARPRILELFRHEWSHSWRPETMTVCSNRVRVAKLLTSALECNLENPQPGLLRLPSGLVVPSGDTHFLPWTALSGPEQAHLAQLMDAGFSRWWKKRYASVDFDEFPGPRVVMVDGGAFVGLVSLAMMDILAATVKGQAPATLMSVEANPRASDGAHYNRAAAVLRRNAESSINWRIVGETALHFTGGSVLFLEENPANFGASYTTAAKPGAPADGAEPRPAIATERIDELLEDGATVGLIKLDLEGAEVNALRGADRILMKDKPALVIEIAPGHLERAGTSPRNLIALLAQYGYELCAVVGEEVRLVPGGIKQMLARAADQWPPQEDRLFMHPDMF